MIQYKDLEQIEIEQALDILDKNPAGYVETFRNGETKSKPAVFITNYGFMPEVLDITIMTAQDLVRILLHKQLYTQGQKDNK